MKITAQFKNDNGHAIVAVFDRDAQTVTAQGGKPATYKRAGPKQLEVEGDSPMTFSFNDEVKFEPGFSTRYSGSTGAGVVTILAVE